MKISRASGYAVLAVLAVAKRQRERPGESVRIKAITSEYKLPHDYIAKLLTGLVKAQILNSGRGRDGGFSLRRPATEISILDIIEATDGPLEVVRLLGESDPADPTWNNVYRHFNEAMIQLRAMLGGYTVHRLLDGQACRGISTS